MERQSDHRPAGKIPAGYSLTELLFVCVLLGTLSSIALGQFHRSVRLAQDVRARADIHTLMTEVEAFHLQNGGLPATLADIGRHGLLDPWGSPYRYLRSGLDAAGPVQTLSDADPTLDSPYCIVTGGGSPESATSGGPGLEASILVCSTPPAAVSQSTPVGVIGGE